MGHALLAVPFGVGCLRICSEKDGSKGGEGKERGSRMALRARTISLTPLHIRTSCSLVRSTLPGKQASLRSGHGTDDGCLFNFHHMLVGGGRSAHKRVPSPEEGGAPAPCRAAQRRSRCGSLACAFRREATTRQAQEQATNLSQGSNPTARVVWNEPHASSVRVGPTGRPGSSRFS